MTSLEGPEHQCVDTVLQHRLMHLKGRNRPHSALNALHEASHTSILIGAPQRTAVRRLTPLVALI